VNTVLGLALLLVLAAAIAGCPPVTIAAFLLLSAVFGARALAAWPRDGVPDWSSATA
jgi:hypothetical protein